MPASWASWEKKARWVRLSGLDVATDDAVDSQPPGELGRLRAPEQHVLAAV